VGKEVWRGFKFHDANRENPADNIGYDGSLQLFLKDGKACARLYVMKSFTDWKEKFNNSWVGFNSSLNKAMLYYNTWQWAVSFPKEIQSDFGGLS
jgi:hypothetical protein